MGSHWVYIAAEFLHVIFGMIWLGGGIMMLFVVVRVAEKDGKVGQFKATIAIGKIVGPFFTIAGFTVVITGVAYMGLKYGWDLGFIWSLSNGRLILVALVLVVFSIVLGIAGATPLMKKLSALKLPDDSTAPIPEEAKAIIKELKMDGYITVANLTVVLVLMVAAANGGF